MNVTLAKNYKLVNIRQSYCNNTKGDVFIGSLCTSYCRILPWRHCRRDHFSLQKWRKIRDFNVDFWKIFLGHSPQTPILGRGYGPPPQTPSPLCSGASRLRASLGTFGPSIDALHNTPHQQFLDPPLRAADWKSVRVDRKEWPNSEQSSGRTIIRPIGLQKRWNLSTENVFWPSNWGSQSRDYFASTDDTVRVLCYSISNSWLLSGARRLFENFL